MDNFIMGELIEYKIYLQDEYDVEKLKADINQHIKAIVAPKDVLVSFVFGDDGRYFLLVSIDYFAEQAVFNILSDADILKTVLENRDVLFSSFSVVQRGLQKNGVEKSINFLSKIKDGKFKVSDFKDFGGEEIRVFETSVSTHHNRLK